MQIKGRGRYAHAPTCVHIERQLHFFLGFKGLWEISQSRKSQMVGSSSSLRETYECLSLLGLPSCEGIDSPTIRRGTYKNANMFHN